MAANILLLLANRRVFLSLTFVICFFALIANFRSLPTKDNSSSPLPPAHHTNNKPSPQNDPPEYQESKKPNPRCDALPLLAEETLIVVKTGANEVHEKLPTQLLTALECYEDIIIFSDLAQSIGHYQIHDALDDVNKSVKATAPEFEYYRKLQDYQENGQDIATLKETSGNAAWNLDKFKFLHILEKTWKMKPGRKWYVFIEADTYLVQTNLLLWLAKMDPKQPLYLGSPTYVKGEAFSHGGSGYILSGEALRKFADVDEGIAQRYDEQVQHEKFGDYMLMKALRDKGVEFSRKWPMLQAEKPSGLPFGPGPDNGARHWCQPIVTMHHITSDEASRLWEFEGKRDDIKAPLLLSELYHDFVASHIRPEREDWYNLSDDQKYRGPGIEGDRQKPVEDMTELEKAAYKSFDDCKKACEEHERCFQFVYHDAVCGFSFSFRLGHRRLPEDEKPFKSGFLANKIGDYEAKRCDGVEWL